MFDYKEHIAQEWIKEQMYEHKESAIMEFDGIIHPPLKQDIAVLIALGFIAGEPEAKRVAQALNLCKKDFVCILEDLDTYEEIIHSEWREEKEESYG